MDSEISPYYLKDHIAQYIHSRAIGGKVEIKDLTKEAIYEAFKDRATKKQIDKVLNEITIEGVAKKRLEFDIYIPENSVNKIPESDRQYIQPHIAWKIGVGLYFSLAILIYVPNLTDNVNRIIGITTLKTALIFYSTILMVSSFIVGHYALKLGKLIMNKIPIIKEYMDLIIPIFTFLLPISLVYIIGIMISQERVSIVHILTIIGISVAGAVGYWSYKKKKKAN